MAATNESVEIFNVDNLENFQLLFKDIIYTRRKPVLIRNLDTGSAKQKWTCEYLSKIVQKSQVKIHVSPVAELDFLNKNFLYKTLEFDEFLKRVRKDVQDDYFICPEEKYYLRSLGVDARKDVANIASQFPLLSDDLIIPPLFEKEKFFSSVFRISSADTNLWTHYDIMDNLLIQIIGVKRVVFFPPSEALNLYLNGDKSEVIDIENPDLSKYPKFKNIKRYSCTLLPGDVLFIPALWFHNVKAVDFCISVNVFWKHLSNDMYDKKDVYGNKDLLPAYRALMSMDKVLRSLQSLPDDYREFYTKRLILKAEDSLIKKHDNGNL